MENTRGFGNLWSLFEKVLAAARSRLGENYAPCCFLTLSRRFATHWGRRVDAANLRKIFLLSFWWHLYDFDLCVIMNHRVECGCFELYKVASRRTL